ncbi:conjugative transposon protein TraM [Spirosoma sp. BT702]|uniref:Conjugative transposon protein TraM n=1 Tax=Spirosoma profusum TaxID=2771354 RepID=A0A926XZZ2_9BACT|nr:conjugative transposon protein TraM [Spirosoma profusum]MBD2703381.1 conjugative transposon protein TraM [Spirosoma profusum]
MNTVLTAPHSDAAFYRKRQAMLIFPLIVLPFIAVLFWLFGGGRGRHNQADEVAAGHGRFTGFNAMVPNAKNGSINGREVDGPGYGKAPIGQMLSTFTNTRQDSISRVLKAIPVGHSVNANPTTHASSLASVPVMSSTPARFERPSNAAALAATQSTPRTPVKAYTYNAPGRRSYQTTPDASQPVEPHPVESSRQLPAATRRVSTGQASAGTSESNPASVRLTDNLTASRLSEPLEPESPFLTAPTGGSRPQPTQAVLSGGSYGQKKAIAWMIPVVVHEDQTLRDGQQVKLRLLKEITADGVTIPSNTILYALCQLSEDRLRLAVRNLQLGNQLIPLDLDVYDTDGSPGINAPGLSGNSQMGGQLRSSVVQGVQLPGMGSLGNTVLNSARMGASNAVRQTTIRLRAGYNLYLKAQ